MNDNGIGCAVTICLILLLAIFVIVLRYTTRQYKEGYVQALVDTERKRPLRYKRVEQENGETI